MYIIVPRPEHLPDSATDLPDNIYTRISAAEELAGIAVYMTSYTGEFHKNGYFEITMPHPGDADVRQAVIGALAMRGWEATYELEKYQQPLLTIRPLEAL